MRNAPYPTDIEPPETGADLRKLRDTARRSGLVLIVTLNGKSNRITAISDCCPGYGSPGFRVESGGGWYTIGAAEWEFGMWPAGKPIPSGHPREIPRDPTQPYGLPIGTAGQLAFLPKERRRWHIDNLRGRMAPEAWKRLRQAVASFMLNRHTRHAAKGWPLLRKAPWLHD